MISESEEEAKRERVPITRDGNSKLARSARVSIEKACREDAQTAMAGALEVKFWMPKVQHSRPSAVPGGWRLPIRPRPPRDGVTLPTCAPVWNRRWLSLLVIRCPYDAPTPMDSSAGSLATDPVAERAGEGRAQFRSRCNSPMLRIVGRREGELSQIENHTGVGCPFQHISAKAHAIRPRPSTATKRTPVDTR